MEHIKGVYVRISKDILVGEQNIKVAIPISLAIGLINT